MPLRRLISFLVIIFIASPAVGQSLSELTNTFLSNLSPELNQRTQYAWEDSERESFNYVPVSRSGPALYDFSETEREQIFAILKLSLSEAGFRKTKGIIGLEQILYDMQETKKLLPNGKPYRDPLRYHFYVFGEPSENSIWGWKFEGHHISLNFTSENNMIVSSTPSFFGTNPGVVDMEGYDRIEVLEKEAELGFALVNALSKKQLTVALFSDIPPPEIVTRMERTVHELTPKGISYDALNENQKELFMQLLNTYVDNYELGFSERLRSKIEAAGIENLFFAWAGSLEPGAGHYYRIQGPTLIIEYDNTQGNANHVHSVVRDLTNDFADDILKRHYEAQH